jgi:hypothetical protein
MGFSNFFHHFPKIHNCMKQFFLKLCMLSLCIPLTSFADGYSPPDESTLENVENEGEESMPTPSNDTPLLEPITETLPTENKATTVTAVVPKIGATSPEEAARASGHYAKARSLLIAAVAEFDKGLKRADPSPLLGVEKWRNGVIDSAEALERILDPQAKPSRGGISYSPDSRLLGLPQK